MRSEVLRLESLCKTLSGERILKNLSFSVFQKETIAIFGADKYEVTALVNALSGISPADSGSVFISDRKVNLNTPLKSRYSGIFTMHQQDLIFQERTVMENMFLGREPHFILNKSKEEKLAREYLNEVGLSHVSPDTIISNLSPEEKALAELATALMLQPNILIFNKAHLFNNSEYPKILSVIFKKLNAAGTAVIYIAENLEYAKQLAERILFINNGAVSGTFDKSLYNSSKFTAISNISYPQKHFFNSSEKDTPLLQVANLTGTYVKNMNFSISRGEILGVYSYDLQVTADVLQLIYGLYSPISGSIFMGGKRIHPKSAYAASKLGIAYVPPPTLDANIFSNMNFKKNLSLLALDRVSACGVIRPHLENYYIDLLAKSMNCSDLNLSSSAETATPSLIRKLLIMRCIASKPKLLLLDEPFSGTDTTARIDIINGLNDLSKKGTAILVASKHLEDLMAICSRTLHIL